MYPSILDIRQNFTDLTGSGSGQSLSSAASSSQSSDYFPTGGGVDIDLESGDDDLSSFDLYSSSTSENPPPPWLYPTLGSVTTTSSTTGSDSGDDLIMGGGNMTTLLDCATLDSNYDPGTALILVAVFVFGILFCIFGKLIRFIMQ